LLWKYTVDWEVFGGCFILREINCEIMNSQEFFVEPDDPN